MLCVDIDSSRYNYAVVDDEPFFLLRISETRVLVTRDRCPHRGGPLRLGSWNARTATLACPWHGTCFTVPALQRKAVPAVRRGEIVTALFAVESGAAVRLSEKRILANER